MFSHGSFWLLKAWGGKTGEDGVGGGGGGVVEGVRVKQFLINICRLGLKDHCKFGRGMSPFRF